MTDSISKQVSFITLGCAKNEVDTAHMSARLVDAGYTVVEWDDQVQDTNLDAIVVNTCSFLREAIEESLDTIFDVAGLPAVVDGNTKLVVAGCMPSRFGNDLATELNEADSFVACADEYNIVEVLDELLGVSRDLHSDGHEVPEMQSSSPSVSTHSAPTQITHSPSAYLKISDGCDRFCSYCAIPYIRGRYKSFTYDAIRAEAEDLVSQGVKELVLIAQDTGIWGSDLEPKRSLAWLLDTLAADFPETWIRVLYIQPEHVSDELLLAMSHHSNICNYLDIPFQHVDKDILSSMNRKGSREDFLELIEKIRSSFDEVALRTTFIVGYPEETEEQFEKLCDFVSEIDFEYVGAFAFSPEEGTRAATLSGQIDEETKQERLRILRDIADTISSSQLSRFIDRTMDVLVLGEEEDGQLLGRSAFQAPDVDGVTYIDSGALGQVIPVKIEDTLYYDMEGSREQ